MFNDTSLIIFFKSILVASQTEEHVWAKHYMGTRFKPEDGV